MFDGRSALVILGRVGYCHIFLYYSDVFLVGSCQIEVCIVSRKEGRQYFFFLGLRD